MPHLGAETGHELLSGDNASVMAYHGGPAVLSSRNGMPTPDLRDLDPSGDLRDWRLGAPPRPDGWGAYVRQLTRIQGTNAQGEPKHVSVGGSRAHKQNLSKLPFHRQFILFDEPVLTGNPLPDPARRAKIAPPEETRVKVVDKPGAVGFKAGLYHRSYVWIFGEDPEHSDDITPAAPSIRVEVAQGQTMEDEIPMEQRPEGATGYGPLCSAPDGPKSSMRLQERVDLRKVGRKHKLKGPFRRTATVVTEDSENRSEVGNFEELGKPRVFRSKAAGTLEEFDTRVGYRLSTRRGPTASQKTARARSPEKGERRALAWQPKDPPAAADGWSPEFVGEDGELYRVPAKDGGEWWPLGRHCEILTNDPAKWPDDSPAPVRIERSRKDESGAPAPKTPLEQPVVAGVVSATPGRYLVYTTNELYGGLWEADEESAPGPPRIVTLRDAGLAAGTGPSGTTDRAIRIYRPSPQSIDNARFTDLSNDGIDLDWDTFSRPAVSVTTGESALTVDDTSGDTSSAGEDLKVSSYFRVDPDRIQAVRMRYDVTRRSGGLAEAQIRYYVGTEDADGNLQPGAQTGSATVVASRNSLGAAWEKKKLGPGTGSAVPSNAKFGRLVFRNRWESGNGRNIAYRVTHIGFWRGAAPRKRYPRAIGLGAKGTESRPAPAAEDPEHPYPPGPYCHLVEAPEDGAPGIPGNYIEYWAPPGTPPSADNFMSRMRVPVKPGVDTILSAYVGSEDAAGGTISGGAELLKTVVKAADGTVVKTNGPMAVVAGDEAWRRAWVHFVPPVGDPGNPRSTRAAYVEFVGSPRGPGEGLIRAGGFQKDENRTAAQGPTAFTNENALAGHLSVVLDTRVPGKQVREAPTGVEQWLGAGAVVTHQENDAEEVVTAASLSFRSGDTAAALAGRTFVGTLEQCETQHGRGRLLEVRVALSTTDATRSPEVGEVYVDLKREDPVLCRADGSEFLGGVRVDWTSAPQKRRNITRREYADGSWGREEVGDDPPRVLSFTLEAFTDEAAEEIADLCGTPLELWDSYRRYEVVIDSVAFEPDDSGYVPTDEDGRDGYFRHLAEVEEAEILSEERI